MILSTADKLSPEFDLLSTLKADIKSRGWDWEFFIDGLNQKEFVANFDNYNIYVKKQSWNQNIIIEKIHKSKDNKHRLDGPAIIKREYANKDCNPINNIEFDWFVDNKPMPDWIPKIFNNEIIFMTKDNYSSRTYRVTKKTIMDVTFKYNRAYGLLLDDIYNKLIAEKEQGIKPLKDLVILTLNEQKNKWINIETYAKGIVEILLGKGFNNSSADAKAFYSLIDEILSNLLEDNKIEFNKEDKLIKYNITEVKEEEHLMLIL